MTGAYREPAAVQPSRLRLEAVRGVHSAVFLVELGSILWLVVSGFLGRRDRSVRVAAGLVGAEVAVFVLNEGVCPLTPLAERWGAVRGSVSDIWLPDRLARTTPIWSSVLLALAGALHARAFVRDRRRARAAIVPLSGGSRRG